MSTWNTSCYTENCSICKYSSERWCWGHHHCVLNVLGSSMFSNGWEVQPQAWMLRECSWLMFLWLGTMFSIMDHEHPPCPRMGSFLSCVFSFTSSFLCTGSFLSSFCDLLTESQVQQETRMCSFIVDILQFSLRFKVLWCWVCFSRSV
jgi:hypothetical protein